MRDIRQEATDLGMTPAEAGRYIEEESDAIRSAAEAREADALMAEMAEEPRDLMVIGTLVTGFYAIEPGAPKRLSPVFSKRSEAAGWIARNA